ncbi:DUF58 domain-containing protein [Gemmatimonas groenlandica]|uniref:DUF58 domain-containing protein n=1 Tax=Gemmatimonas groenlandica TaxID=2732249 RepID=A0A6M4IUP1_9BACT|nr:DUF58 domain-containing protein [Gemmatimonas groenlandica]QJR35871.1 DUF58 domain-containing protein [Gemmatimonas groenlandica]
MSADYGPLLDALRGVRWPARRAVAAAPSGAHRSRQRGTAGEFTEYRLYRQGDDPRALDWKLLARSDRAFVRLSDDRALLPTWIVLDGSASMDFPDGVGMSKWRMACAVAVGLAAVAHASGDPVGVLAMHADGVLRMPPRTRRGTVREIARSLDAVQAGGTSTLAATLMLIPVSARCVLVTDCLGDHEATIKNASVLAAGGAMLECVHIVAREELTLPAGIFRAQDPEDAAIWRVTSPDVQRGYASRFDAFRAQVRDQWRALGAGYTEVPTNVTPARAVRAVVAGLAL